MGYTFRTAPKEVIDELDAWQEMPESENSIYQLLSDVFNENLDDALVHTKAWACESGLTSLEQLRREYGIIDHIFAGERLRPEREARYYVVNVPYTEDGTLLTYAMNVYGNGPARSIVSFFQNKPRKAFSYENGMSLVLAEGIIAEFGGGEIKEMK